MSSRQPKCTNPCRDTQNLLRHFPKGPGTARQSDERLKALLVYSFENRANLSISAQTLAYQAPSTSLCVQIQVHRRTTILERKYRTVSES